MLMKKDSWLSSRSCGVAGRTGPDEMIVLDANILIRAVLGRRVRQLIEIYANQGVRFFAPDVAFDDAENYLPLILKKHGMPTTDVSASLNYLRTSLNPLRPNSMA